MTAKPHITLALLATAAVLLAGCCPAAPTEMPATSELIAVTEEAQRA